VAYIEIGDRCLSADEVADLLATDHPMVRRFRLDKQGEEPGHSLRFALVIEAQPGVRYQQHRDSAGGRMEPVWRTLDGTERIGQGNRALWREGDGAVAENLTFFPDQRFNDLGIGSALYVSMERLYRALGVRRVTLLAVDVGVYVWARQGFAFLQPDMADELASSLEQFLFGHGLPMPGAGKRFDNSWDLANHADPDGRRVEGYRTGKAFMLRAAPPWHGIKQMDDPQSTAVAEASRRQTFARLPVMIEGASADLVVR